MGYLKKTFEFIVMLFSTEELPRHGAKEQIAEKKKSFASMLLEKEHLPDLQPHDIKKKQGFLSMLMEKETLPETGDPDKKEKGFFSWLFESEDIDSVRKQ